ncbi:transcription factor [Arabidopsis lyrata subsp. lyrata]|uniref:Transcription factor n=1 Tax=Arabidopsis lyrata subsp. lyrata TaxID=81972 RepID=D7L4N5_ARALL|nr:transcription factor bHLH150 [Arabidopsis lyrata subsp. lyrata]EFH58695.1 transcription factor [Arabidopsis lyrata subsp. lyrata]|eukprot:XP_002882436.1 transcription factor bHLH150 [Arabidopsis lyrata subsp. lyrata]
MSSEQGNGSNSSTSPEVEGTKTIPFRRRMQRAQRVLAPKLMEALRRSRISSEEAPAIHLSRRWRATTAQKVYSLKLYDALQRSRRSATVRDTADKVLATTARGVTRWSRAILVSRFGTSLRRRRNTKPAWAMAAAVRGSGGRRRRKVSAVGSRVRVLGGLVPGCRRTALPELLDETADYIAALEMQVRAMTALSKILSEFQPSTKLGSAL